MDRREGRGAPQGRDPGWMSGVPAPASGSVGKIAFFGHHLVDVGKDFVDEPFPPSWDGLRRVISGGGAFVVVSPIQSGRGVDRGRGLQEFAGIRAVCPQTGRYTGGWGRDI